MTGPLSDLRGKAGLLRRFPGLLDQLGQAVGTMSDHLHGPMLVRAWVDIQPERPRDVLPSPWVAWVRARALDGTTWRFPVIPDEHNPRADGLVQPDDKPYVFLTLAECEAQAEKARDLLEGTLHKMLQAATGAPPATGQADQQAKAPGRRASTPALSTFARDGQGGMSSTPTRRATPSTAAQIDGSAAEPGHGVFTNLTKGLKS